MQKTGIIFFLFISLASCTKDKTAGEKLGDNSINTDSTKIIALGKFLPTAGISARGTASIVKYADTFRVQLDSFYVSSGPDLKVYLSTKATPAEFINLGFDKYLH